MSGRSEAARNAAARSDVRQLRLALDTLARDTGRYPTAAEGLGALIDPPPGLAGWQGPYVRRFPNDPWGRPYVYVPPTASPPPKGGPYVDFPAGPLAPQVLSLGPDGKQGSADDVGSR